MKSLSLLENGEFHPNSPYAEPLFISDEARILRFTLRPGQIVQEHNAPHSPVFVTVLQGRGLFAGADGVERPFGPNSLVIFDAGESHSIQALNEPLVVLVFLCETPDGGPTEHHQVAEEYAA